MLMLTSPCRKRVKNMCPASPGSHCVNIIDGLWPVLTRSTKTPESGTRSAVA
ncbi:hypothetical protein KCP77_13340 [Salmonella enterica subsp. enterica]|nr:hypothetical protein KCP77_13340 [Salmonella enterica subsp. enterica]